MDRGTRKGESWIQPPGGSSGFQKELIAAPERVDRRFISVGSWNHIGWIVEPEKVKPGFTPLGVVPRLKKSGSRNQKGVVLSSKKGESWFHLFWNPIDSLSAGLHRIPMAGHSLGIELGRR